MSSITDRNVGTLDINIPLPHHLSPTHKLPRNNSESSIISTSSTPTVPRSSSFTRSKRFLTGKGLSARESLGIIDTDLQAPTDYQAVRDIIKHTLTHSPKDAPPPPPPSPSLAFVTNRPPTPPSMPDFSSPTPKITPKRVRIDPKPPIELPAADPIDITPDFFSTPEPHPLAQSNEKKRTPLRTLSPLRNRLSLSPSTPSKDTHSNLQHPKAPKQSVFGLLSSRITRREGLPNFSPRLHPSAAERKQNAAPLNIADLANAPKLKVHFPTRRTDENNKPVLPVKPVSPISPQHSPIRPVPSPAKPVVIIDQLHSENNQRPHVPLGREKRIIIQSSPKENESTETNESDKYKDCESPSSEPRRRIEIFRRFRFIQEGRQRPEQLSDFIQTDVLEKAHDLQLDSASPSPLAPRMRVQPLDPISHHDDLLSFTSAHEDGDPSSDDEAPPAMRDIRKLPRMRMRLPKPVEPEPRLLEEEKGHLPHVESVTTSSSSNSKDTSDSPPIETRNRHVFVDTSVPFSQVEMPHLRLGKGTVTAHAFMDGPSPSKMGKVAQLRRDSHVAFLNVSEEPKLDEIKYGGHKGERETAPLGPRSGDDSPKEGEMKKTMSGLQRKLKEAGAEIVSAAKKFPRGASFSKLRSNSMKDLRSGIYGRESDTDGETEVETVPKNVRKGIERSRSLPRDSLREAPKCALPEREVTTKKIPERDVIAKKSPEKQERKADEDGSTETKAEMPEFVTIKRIIRRVRRDGTEEIITKKVRVRPERILPNGDVVVKRTMKRNKDDGEGTETLTVLQVIPRRKNVKKTAGDGESQGEDKKTGALGRTTQSFHVGALKGSGSFGKRRSSGRSKTDMVDEGGRWRRARSFGRVRGETEAKDAKGFLGSARIGSRGVDRETGRLGESGGWLKKKSLPRVMSFHGRTGRRKESAESSKSEGSWWRFRRAVL